MFSKILEQDVFAAVISASPGIRSSDLAIATDVLKILQQETQSPNRSKVFKYNGTTHFELKLSEILFQMPRPEQISSRLLGYVLAQMGIGRDRRRDGYCAVWSKRQMEILQKALGRYDGNSN